MPRTKVSKNSKRNRDVANREEKIREFESLLEETMTGLETQAQNTLDQIDERLDILKSRMSNTVLQMKFGDFLDLNLLRFSDTSVMNTLNMSRSVCNATTPAPAKRVESNGKDEGYLTADSDRGSSASSAVLAAYTSAKPMTQQRGRTPGPLSSARAKQLRRSKSACAAPVLTQKSTPAALMAMSNAAALATDHASRGKLRMPISTRAKAVSADRASRCNPKEAQSPPAAFMRWPKPGELMLSAFGSPLVPQALPDNFANVNIPMRNGVLSLRPKKLHELKPELIDAIEPETLHQIETLHENLKIIMSMANKGENKEN